MARDLQIKHLCPHEVRGEWLAIQPSDRQTLRPVMPPTGGAGQIRMRVNGQEVPNTGLYSQIIIAGSAMPPYDIFSGINDEVRFKYNQEDYVITLRPGRYVGVPGALSKQIQDACPALQVTATPAGGMQITTRQGGAGLSLFLEGGSAHGTLGLPPYRLYQSRQVVPPWALVKPQGNPDPYVRYIKFQDPLQTADDIIELSYFTRRADCRRCQSIGVENDLRHDARGEPVFVTGLDLLVQEVEKIVLTIRGSNVFYTWYGTSISDLIGSKIIKGGQFIEAKLVGEISAALAKYKNVKDQQALHQPVGEAEALLRIQNISVTQDDMDPTVFHVVIALQNRAYEVESITKTIVLSGY